MTEGEVSGLAKAPFETVREAFAANLANGADVGASFAATVEARRWSICGAAGPTRPHAAVEKGHIVNVYSTTKTMTALTALLSGRPRRTGLRCAGGALLAGIRGQRQGGGQGQPPDEPLGRSVGLEGADQPGGRL